MRSLHDVFVNDLGLDLAGWSLTPGQSGGGRDIRISADGKVIVGSGTNPSGNRETWMVVVPELATGPLTLIGLLVFASSWRGKIKRS